MSVLELHRIEAIAADPARRTAAVPDSPPDLSLPFMPEDQTQLYYTPGYALLTRAQKIRYNQLFALRVNEYIMMLERDFVDPVLKALRRRALAKGSPALRKALEGMLAEEERHYEAFVALNRRCAPRDYERVEAQFMRLRSYEHLVLHAMHAGARWLPFALWIIIAMEESSIGLASSMARHGEGALGRLEPGFVAVHREHSKDEARHIHIDVHLVRACLATLPGAWRALNAKLFTAFMRDMTAPKATGTGARVVRRLVAEFPELAPHERELIAGLVALKDHREFQTSLFNRKLTPLAFALYDAEPALAQLGKVLKAYERPAAA
jgi:P-aminobenzoate N-oxygenase AurF